MATTIQIKRSTGTSAPSSLSAGELAVTFGTGTQSNLGDRLFIGDGSTVEVEKYKCSGGFDPEIMISNSAEPCASFGADGRDVSGESDPGLKEVSIGWRLNGATETFQTQVKRNTIEIHLF